MLLHTTGSGSLSPHTGLLSTEWKINVIYMLSFCREIEYLGREHVSLFVLSGKGRIKSHVK